MCKVVNNFSNPNPEKKVSKGLSNLLPLKPLLLYSNWFGEIGKCKVFCLESDFFYRFMLLRSVTLQSMFPYKTFRVMKVGSLEREVI